MFSTFTLTSAVIAGASIAAATAAPVLQCVPAVVLLGFAIGEVRQTWLRRRYRTPSSMGGAPLGVNLTQPITTTDLRLTHYRLPANLAPSRLRILHFTDLHFNTKLPGEYFESLHEIVRQQAPDVLLLGGDFISKVQMLPLLTAWLQHLPKVKLGTFAVLGNHDYWCKANAQVCAELERCGITWVAGRHHVLTKMGDRHLVLCGTEAPWGPSAQTNGIAPNDFVIALSHSPDNVYATRNTVDLMLAGHNHAGQLRLPGLGAIVVPSRYGRRFDRGAFRVGRTQLFVSAGIGVDGPHFRLYCPPEIVVVDLE